MEQPQPHPYVKWVLPYIAVVVTLVLSITSVNAYKLDVRAIEAQQDIVEATLDRQKICSDAQPEYCRDLFERLSENISDKQRERLACAVAPYLEVELAPETVCPKAQP